MPAKFTVYVTDIEVQDSVLEYDLHWEYGVEHEPRFHWDKKWTFRGDNYHIRVCMEVNIHSTSKVAIHIARQFAQHQDELKAQYERFRNGES